jgi:methylglutaconyl-CoA hydratase
MSIFARFSSDPIHADLDTRGVLTLELNRPETRNAFDQQLLETLLAMLEAARREPSVRLVLLTGRGPVFCAGGDVRWMAHLAEAAPEERLRAARLICDAAAALHQSPHPVVCVVQGAAIGGGVALVAAADLVLAAADARFGLSEARLGLAPACAAPFLLARIGPASTRRFFLAGQRVSAADARQAGLVDELAPDAEGLAAMVRDRVEQMLLCGPQALRHAKRLVDELCNLDRDFLSDAHLARAAQAMSDLWASPEGREGLAAYLEKRPPSWH